MHRRVLSSSVATDSELVVRHVGGDRQALADIHDRYADRVHDLFIGIVASGDDTADAVSDTFLVAARRLDGLGDPSRLRSWLYAIARSRCRRRFRSDEELAVLVAESRAGLNERHREILDLHMRHGLDDEELAEVLEISTVHAYRLVQRVRDRVERSLGALLVARHGREDCVVLAALLTGRESRFTLLMRRRVARHIDDCAICERRRRRLLAPGGLAAVLPLITAPAALRARITSELGSALDDPPPPPPSREPAGWLDNGFPETQRR
jgi:DNA-directed RNA polymerase specialized sigma24 family protein